MNAFYEHFWQALCIELKDYDPILYVWFSVRDSAYVWQFSHSIAIDVIYRFYQKKLISVGL